MLSQKKDGGNKTQEGPDNFKTVYMAHGTLRREPEQNTWMTFRTWQNRLKNFRYSERGANVNLADSNGINRLAHARQRDYGQIMEVLSAAGGYE